MQLGIEDYMISLISFILGVCLTIIVAQVIARTRSKTFEQDLQRQIDGAKKEAENIIKSAQIEASAETIRKKEEFTKEVNKIRTDLHEAEVRLNKREDGLARDFESLKQKEREFKEDEKEIARRISNINS